MYNKIILICKFFCKENRDFLLLPAAGEYVERGFVIDGFDTGQP